LRSFVILAFIVAEVSLTSCTGHDAVSGYGQGLSPEQKKLLYLTDVTAETAPNVTMDKKILDRIVGHVRD